MLMSLVFPWGICGMEPSDYQLRFPDVAEDSPLAPRLWVAPREILRGLR